MDNGCVVVLWSRLCLNCNHILYFKFTYKCTQANEHHGKSQGFTFTHSLPMSKYNNTTNIGYCPDNSEGNNFDVLLKMILKSV